ncbi:hypothetical protein GCM10018951_26430 [Pseudarthrobacter polychromogenes]
MPTAHVHRTGADQAVEAVQVLHFKVVRVGAHVSGEVHCLNLKQRGPAPLDPDGAAARIREEEKYVLSREHMAAKRPFPPHPGDDVPQQGT